MSNKTKGLFKGNPFPTKEAHREYYNRVADEEIGKPPVPKTLEDVLKATRYRKRVKKVKLVY